MAQATILSTRYLQNSYKIKLPFYYNCAAPFPFLLNGDKPLFIACFQIRNERLLSPWHYDYIMFKVA